MVELLVHVHTYPVDSSLSPEDAWKEICIFGKKANQARTF